MVRICSAVAISVMMLVAMVCSADETLVGHWAFEEGSGDSVEDLSDAGNDGAVMGDATWVAGKIGGGMEFSRAGQSYVEIVNSDTLGASEQITIAAWIKPSEIYIGAEWQQRNCIAAKVRAYYLDISEQGMLSAYLYNVQPQAWLVGETDMSNYLNTWVHVALVYDGSDQKLYINGELDASEAKSGNITVNADNLAIGWVDNNRYFDGVIDEVMIWTRAVTEEELASTLAVRSDGKLATCWAAIK